MAEQRPHVDWRIAGITARPGLGAVPDVTRRQAHSVVAALRLAADRAGELAAVVSGLAAAPAEAVHVVDRDGWAAAAMRMVDAALAGLPLSVRRAGARRTAQGVVYGAVGGLALGLVGRRLLGQFDGFSRRPALYLLAPNVVEYERRLALPSDDFRLWVAAHEQTHALQFGAAPWLRAHLLERFAAVALESRGGRAALRELGETMTLLEGHAELVADEVGRAHLPAAARLRRAFPRPAGRHPLSRLLPGADKNAQYRDGLAFCRAVAARVGMAGLAAAFYAPANLPGTLEIHDPAAWLRRVHGTP